MSSNKDAQGILQAVFDEGANALRVAMDSSDFPQQQLWSRPGTAAVETGAGRWVLPHAITVTGVRAAVGTAPTDASLIVDVHKNGTTLFTTQGNRPTIAATGNLSDVEVPDVTAVAAGDYLTVDVDQVGSTVAGADLSVVIAYTVD